MSARHTTRQQKRWLFLSLAVIGSVLPLNYFFRFVSSEGINLSLFLQQLFANNVAALFAMDLFVSALVLWVFVVTEGKRLQMKNLWIYFVCTMVVGVSLAFPLFLFFRERPLKDLTTTEN